MLNSHGKKLKAKIAKYRQKDELPPKIDLDPDKLGLLAGSFFAMIVFAVLSFVVKPSLTKIAWNTALTFLFAYLAVFIMVRIATVIVLPEIEEKEEEEEEVEKEEEESDESEESPEEKAMRLIEQADSIET